MDNSISEREKFNAKILDEIREDISSEKSVSEDLGKWKWNLLKNTITVDPLRLKSLGLKKEDLPNPVTTEFFNEMIYVEDYSEVRDDTLALLLGEINGYEVVYRIRKKEHGYNWFYDQCDVSSRDLSGKPLLAEGITYDVSEFMNAYESQFLLMLKESISDTLTQINNRQTMVDHLKTEIEKAQINMQYVSAAIFTVNDFLEINEMEGHLLGDYILRRTADLLKDSVKDTDIVGRYGPDKFMVIFIDTQRKFANEISKTICQTVNSFVVGTSYKINLSYTLREYKGETELEFINMIV